MILIGTYKGAFIYNDGKLLGPFFAGRGVNAMLLDDRSGDLWVAAMSMHTGADLCKSSDMGKTFDEPTEMRIKFPAHCEVPLENIWQLQKGTDDDTLYCGVAPAALFTSTDGGESWTINSGLWDHPHRPQWTPGFGGLCLHTILTDPADPNHLTVAISTGGVYHSYDLGLSWEAANSGVSAYFLPDPNPEFGQCVHKIARSPKDSKTLFLQNHRGVYRSLDNGKAWETIENGLPGNFGFGITASGNGSVFIIPLESDYVRYTCEGKLRVYRSDDNGDTWLDKSAGLPQENAYEIILRDGLDSKDSRVAFGTKTGKLYLSENNGDSWDLIFDSLPGINCVRVI